MTKTDAQNVTRAVRTDEQLDWASLDDYLKAELEWLSGEAQVSQFPGGNSNLTYLLEYDNAKLVVRRPPLGTKAKSAHSMIREYKIMNSLRPVYPSVPEMLCYSDNEEIIGAEFYVMRHVEGQVVRSELPSQWRFSQQDTRGFCQQFWDKLIELHQVDYEAIGLSDFGQPEGYAERQVKGWNGRYERAVTPDVHDFSDVRQWLEDNIPASSSRHSILHGDFRIDNVILAPDNPFEIRAVIDWEICALGDPLMDLGNALAYWVQADDPYGLRQMILQPSDAPGMLTRREILDYYQSKTGIDTRHFTFYEVYGYWRNAVIVQQIYYRYFHGQTQDKRFSMFNHLVMQLGGHCRQLIGH